jgi:hypothetical protein
MAPIILAVVSLGQHWTYDSAEPSASPVVKVPAPSSAPAAPFTSRDLPKSWKKAIYQEPDEVTTPPAPAPSSGLSVFTTSKGVEVQRRVDSQGNVQIDFPGGDPKDFASPTVYERAKERLQAASALAPATLATPVAVPASVAPVAPATPMPPASSLGGPAPASAAQPPAYAPPVPVQAASSWQPLSASPGYEAYGTVGPDGVWRYDPATVRPMAGWAAQGQVQPAVSYAPPAYYSAPASSPCGPYGCSIGGGPGYARPGLFGGLFRR